VTEPRAVRRLAHAKLNVCLRVLGRRDDGYHEVETLVLPLELHDVVEVSPGADLAVEVTGPRAADLADAGGERLALAAARALAERCSVREGATIRIDKRIPVAAGLGGGSADAAATLLALDEVWGCGAGTDLLAEVAVGLGSDVPAMLAGGATFCTGRGEVARPVHAQTTFWVVRSFGFGVATADAYRWWDEDGAATGPDPGALVAAFETGNDELTGSALANDLQAGVARRHPEVAEAIEASLETGALGAVMTGSGPTVVALARHLADADRIAAAVPGSFVTSGPPRTMADGSGVV
jgi:4-diphosphocytidyl-2-C-methyl-D-erythritol kinase